MKKNFFIIAFLLCFLNLFATDYYLSSSTGNDTNDGESETTPWKTITKLNTIMGSLRAGDNVLFKSGDTFRGSITPTVSGTFANRITFGAYGTGNKPIITGTEIITGWTNAGGNIWQKTWAGSNDITEVFINGKAQIVGRYPKYTSPNKGYYEADNTTSTTITDSALSGSVNWTGAEIVIRTVAWVFDMGRVTALSGNTVTFERSRMGYNPAANSGYFFQHDPRACTVQGEWSYNKVSKVISIYSTTDPNLATIEVTAYARLFDLQAGKNYYTFDNLHLRGASNYLIYASVAQFVNVQNCELADSMKGIHLNGSNDWQINNNYMHNLRSNAIGTSWEAQRTNVSDNIFNNIANVPGMGTSSVSQNDCIAIFGNDFTCYRNRITNVAYIGISWRGQGSMVKWNYVDNYCSELDDGGGIYTYDGASEWPSTVQCEVMYNTVLNGIGAIEGKPGGDGFSQAMGFYADDGSDNIKVWNNTFSNISTYGVLLHNADKVDIQYNTFYNSNQIFRFYDDSLHPNNCVNNIIKNNTVVGLNTRADSQIFSLQGGTEMKTQNTINNNRYIQPYGNASMAAYYFGIGDFDSSNSFTAWRTLWGAGYDFATVFGSPIALTTENPDDYIKLVYNETNKAKVITLTDSYVDVNGNFSSSTFTLEPYTSKILFKKKMIIPLMQRIP